MRVAVVVVVCALCACAQRNGTYLVVDGEQSGIAFDQVEFFIGKNHGKETPFTPGNPYLAQSELTGETQRLLKRQFVGSDLQTTSLTKTLSYYLAPGEANPLLQYAIAVASRGGEVVGVGEVEFVITDDGAYLYEIPLVPVPTAGFERWGIPDQVPGDSCVRWKRRRGEDAAESTYVVSRADDRDCDGEPEVIDCDDLNYCPVTANGPTCTKRFTPCVAAETCDLGTCVDGLRDMTREKSCTPTTCLNESFCRPADDCIEAGPTGEFLDCAIKISLEHTEILMPVKSVGGPPCKTSYDVDPPSTLNCLAPEIVFPQDGKVSADWTFSVMTSASSPDYCTFTLIYTGDPADAADVDAPTTHLVVSVQLTSTSPLRSSFVIGFAPLSNATGTCMELVGFKPQPTSSPNPRCP